MTYQIFQLPKNVLHSGGALKPSWKVSFFLTGTTTPTPVYTTSALSVAHTQPVQADSGGTLATIYLDPSIVYKASVYDQNDVLQYTIDPVNDSVLSQATIGELLYPRTAAEISAGVTPTSYAYPSTDLRRYGLPVDGTSDCTAALNSAIAVANAFTIGMEFEFPRGTYVFASRPTDIVAPISIRGAGMNATYLKRDYTAASSDIGLFNLRHGAASDATGCTFEDFFAYTGSAKTGGSVISIVSGNASDGPDYITMTRLRLGNSVSGGGTGNGPDYPLYIDGVLRNPGGQRNTWISDSIIFGGALGSVYLKYANGFHATNTDTASSGSVSGKVVAIGVSGQLLSNLSWRGGAVAGIDLDYAQLCTFDLTELSGAVTNTSNVTQTMIRGRQTSGTVQTNWQATTCSYEDATGTPNQGRIFNGDVVCGASANIGSLPRHYSKGASGGGAAYYGEQQVAGGYVYNSQAYVNAGSYYHFNFIDGSTSHGSITSNGTNTAYNTSSDARLKFNILPADAAGLLIDAIQVRKFDWKVNGSHQRYGVVAQEIEKIFPECVTVGIDDDATLAVDYSKLVPLLVKEVQSLRQRVADLEAA